MEENEYRSFYHAINQQRCVFEKTILSRRAHCQYAHRFNLADREGVACREPQAAALCQATLTHMRDNALFALKLTRLDGPLPHAKEIKVQTGGLYGLQQLLGESDINKPIENIFGLLQSALERYGEIPALPYTEIARSIVQFEGRTRRNKKSD
ncbi:MAG: hypothetical protein GC149_03915 [Gammaproteobacteria bacterium]|nr:hypothetical protein [Gammaproteobacteria bacterium]